VNGKPVLETNNARFDVDIAARYYAREAGLDIAEAFISGVEAAYAHIAENPKTGSPRYAELANLPGLRHRKLQGFPYLVFYIESDDHISVVRVLHAARNIPAWLGGPDD
jgi:toxin ParE1/3/4